MPFCEACDRHWTPTSLRPDGACPTCGKLLELTKVAPAATNDEEGPKAPWHFKLMLWCLVIYLGWRGVQGVEWLASHI